MLTLLLGPDDFSKNEYVARLAKNPNDLAVFDGVEGFVGVDGASQTDLFGGEKIYVLKNLLKEINQPRNIEKFVNSKNQIIIVEEKLDKRLADNKQLLANKNITIREFSLPHGQDLDRWIIDRVKSLDGKIQPKAADALAVALGRDDAKETKVGGKIIAVEEIYNLWQADSEIRKLIAYAAGKEITVDDVKSLAVENREVDVFDLTNSIADGQKLRAMELMHNFLKSQTGSDEKGAVIQLNALLSEQFRNVAMVQDFINAKKSENSILELTGWKSGRLFVIKKIASRFPLKKVLDFLTKLQALDEELKTSQTPPRVLLDLIVSQLLI